jgi:sarcosine oxidase, subunit delta
MRLRCPFCGVRDETEFFFAAEAGKARPEPALKADAESWAAYLYVQANPKGIVDEVWLHRGCGLYFRLTRDTVTNQQVTTA